MDYKDTIALVVMVVISHVDQAALQQPQPEHGENSVQPFEFEARAQDSFSIVEVH